MAEYINKTLIKGRLGKKPEIRYLPSGDAVSSFSVATKFGNHVEWHSIVAYKEEAERAATFDSGDMVFIDGRIQTREFHTAEDKALNRKPRKVTEIIAETVSLTQKKGANDPQQIMQAQTQAPARQLQPSQQAEFAEPESNDYVPGFL